MSLNKGKDRELKVKLVMGYGIANPLSKHCSKNF